jgi:lysozyme
MAVVKQALTPIALSEKGAEFIGHFEGLRLFPYQDGGGLWTLGFGHRIVGPTPYKNGITKEQAAEWLIEDAKSTANGLMYLKLDLPLQHHQDAVISLVYNIGLGAFRKSIIYATLEAKSTDLYAWDAWVRDAKGVTETGLVKRRNAEQRLFVWADYDVQA